MSKRYGAVPGEPLTGTTSARVLTNDSTGTAPSTVESAAGSHGYQLTGSGGVGEGVGAVAAEVDAVGVALIGVPDGEGAVGLVTAP